MPGASTSAPTVDERDGRLTVTVVGAAEFPRWADQAVEVYLAAMGRPAGVAGQRRMLLDQHVGRPGFVGIVAVQQEALVGFTYGALSERGQWWHDAVRAALGEQAPTWLGEAYEVVELHVRPAWHGRGIGRRLLSLLLEHAGGRTVVLSTHDTDSPARRLYRSTGFVDLLTAFRFPGAVEQFAVMGRPAPPS